MRLYHGTTAQAAEQIRQQGEIEAGRYFGGIVGVALTPRRDVAAEFAGEGGVVFAVDVDTQNLVVDPESVDHDDVARALDEQSSVYALGNVRI